MPRTKKELKKTKKPVYTLPENNYLSRIETDIKSNQSRLSMILGGLIILVVGILIFNYFNKGTPSLGPAQQNEQQAEGDVSPDKLPGKYTVKEGDTLFLIAENYYKDGSKFEEIAKANNMTDVNAIVVGQVIVIPKLEQSEAMALPTSSPTESPTPSASAEPTSAPSAIPSPTSSSNQNAPVDLATGGSNNTIWGSKIEGTTYTVQEGDWLSTIAARAYGDIFAYTKIAAANNISNPDYIVPGMVLKIQR